MRINVYNQNNVTLRVFFNLKLREKNKNFNKKWYDF